MNTADPNLPLLESVVRALGPLCDQLVFVGGCATGLLITESAAPPVRATKDVDAIVETLSLTDYLHWSADSKTKDLGTTGPWVHPYVAGPLEVPFLTSCRQTKAFSGFGSRWYTEAVHTATQVDLPSGRKIRLISPPVFLGIKLEAFHGRGDGDFIASSLAKQQTAMEI